MEGERELAQPSVLRAWALPVLGDSHGLPLPKGSQRPGGRGLSKQSKQHCPEGAPDCAVHSDGFRLREHLTVSDYRLSLSREGTQGSRHFPVGSMWFAW